MTLFSPSPPSSSLQQIPDSDTQSAPDDESILASLPPTLRDIVRLFRTVSSTTRAISDLEASSSSEESVRVRFEADSDAKFTKGLAFILVQGLSGCPASEVVRAPGVPRAARAAAGPDPFEEQRVSEHAVDDAEEGVGDRIGRWWRR
ncbi:hypothetical protein QJS10_CPB13g01043 [Acorus calamus]|uniref:Fe-S metabolism associated domain-containing protein n=1 Tax=Acorus calamus TaxID=4465 RepID=A0AAV9DIN1_ACOCL|nr:hypothetical protein QJS10_CPB13g01043 [Acorus calamus]